MAKFKFQFDAVLQQRLAQEELRQRELAKVLRQRLIFHTHLRQMQQTITQSKHDLASGLVGKVNLEAISQFARFSGQVSQRARMTVAKLAALEKTIAAARQRLLEATRARRALELLRDRQHQQWLRLQDAREQMVLDEIAVGQFARKAMGLDE